MNDNCPRNPGYSGHIFSVLFSSKEFTTFYFGIM